MGLTMITIDRTAPAYVEGREDFGDFIDVSENPHPEHAQEHGQWLAGWLDAEADACERQGLRAAEEAGR